MGHKVTAATIVVGCDVGKTHHQIHAINADLERLGRRRIRNTRSDIDDVLGWARRLGEDVVLVIDQKASYAGAVAVLRSR